MPRIISPDELKARTIIASPARNNPQELHDLAKRLMDANKLEYAQKLFARALAESEKSDRELRHAILRRLALCTYKNPDEPVAERLTAAAQILEGELLPDQSLSRAQRQDALGIAGAVYKSRWQVYGLRQHLEKALEYYRSGMEFGIQLDTGYTAINAAFVLDLLAAGGASEKTNGQLILEGEEIRNNVRDTLLRMGDQHPVFRPCPVPEASSVRGQPRFFPSGP